jgi:hypothetical protein
MKAIACSTMVGLAVVCLAVCIFSLSFLSRGVDVTPL